MSRLQELNAKLAKEHSGCVGSTDKFVHAHFLRRPSGITQLDIDTAGGLPGGSAVCISGREGVGKSYLLYQYFAMHQRIYGNDSMLALCNTESGFDHFEARSLGVQVAVPPDLIEEHNAWRKAVGLAPLTTDAKKELSKQLGVFTLIAAPYMEKMFDIITAIMESNLYGIVAVDSISEARPKAMADKESMEDSVQQAAHASALTRFFQQQYFPLVNQLSEQPLQTTLVFTHQARANRKKSEASSFMAKYIKDYETEGGSWALKHNKAIDIQLASGEKDKDKKSGEQLGKMMKWELVKGKLGTHEGVKGEVEFDFNNPRRVDMNATLLAAGIAGGVILANAGGITLLDVEKKEVSAGVKGMAKTEFLDRLTTDPTFEILVRTEVMRANKIACRFR